MSLNLNDYQFDLPSALIANQPASPRDSARLMVYSRQSATVAFNTFRALPKLLPAKAVLVLNDTRVIPARIWGRRATGGKTEVLVLKQTAPNLYQVMVSRRLLIGETITLDGGLSTLVDHQEEKFYWLQINLTFPQLVHYLDQHGQMPLPPYIKHPHSRDQLSREYQTVFAREPGSVAAPTASLHFSKRLLNELTKAGITLEFVTLHVGLGTFLPLTEEQLQSGQLHREYYEVQPQVYQRLIGYQQARRPIIPVGTTAMRTLETVIRNPEMLKGETNLFIRPGFEFQMATGLITNFHLPQTSLLLLVAAFIGSREQTLSLYQQAIDQKMRFYSFGDGMLIL